jgi:hypothetical protein
MNIGKHLKKYGGMKLLLLGSEVEVSIIIPVRAVAILSGDQQNFLE